MGYRCNPLGVVIRGCGIFHLGNFLVPQNLRVHCPRWISPECRVSTVSVPILGRGKGCSESSRCRTEAGHVWMTRRRSRLRRLRPWYRPPVTRVNYGWDSDTTPLPSLPVMTTPLTPTDRGPWGLSRTRTEQRIQPCSHTQTRTEKFTNVLRLKFIGSPVLPSLHDRRVWSSTGISRRKFLVRGRSRTSPK